MSEAELINTTNTDTLEPEVLSSSPNRRPFYTSKKFIITMISLVALALAIFWLINVFSTYRNSKKYKVAYDTLREQLDYCKNPRANKDEDPSIPVHYCDKLRIKFQGVQY
jgi:hypothetical protein